MYLTGRWLYSLSKETATFPSPGAAEAQPPPGHPREHRGVPEGKASARGAAGTEGFSLGPRGAAGVGRSHKELLQPLRWPCLFSWLNNESCRINFQSSFGLFAPSLGGKTYFCHVAWEVLLQGCVRTVAAPGSVMSETQRKLRLFGMP